MPFLLIEINERSNNSSIRNVIASLVFHEFRESGYPYKAAYTSSISMATSRPQALERTIPSIIA